MFDSIVCSDSIGTAGLLQILVVFLLGAPVLILNS